VLRVALWVGLACTVALLALVAVAFATDAASAKGLLTLVGLTTVSGPQAAALFAFTALHPPLPLGWALAGIELNALATAGLVVPLAWKGLERLRGVRLTAGAVLGAVLTVAGIVILEI